MKRNIYIKISTKDTNQTAFEMEFDCNRPEVMQNDSFIENSTVYAAIGIFFPMSNITTQELFTELFDSSMQTYLFLLWKNNHNEIIKMFDTYNDLKEELEKDYDLSIKIWNVWK